MRVYLVRHGEALRGEEDPQRPLSARGMRQAAQVAAFLSPLGIQASAVWHSGKTRAEQTAGILRQVLSGAQLAERAGLNPNDDPAPLADELGLMEGDVFIVGHLPHLGRLASLLLVGATGPDVLRLGTASIACLQRADYGDWRLAWLVYPELVAPD